MMTKGLQNLIHQGLSLSHPALRILRWPLLTLSWSTSLIGMTSLTHISSWSLSCTWSKSHITSTGLPTINMNFYVLKFLIASKSKFILLTWIQHFNMIESFLTLWCNMASNQIQALGPSSLHRIHWWFCPTVPYLTTLLSQLLRLSLVRIQSPGHPFTKSWHFYTLFLCISLSILQRITIVTISQQLSCLSSKPIAHLQNGQPKQLAQPPKEDIKSFKSRY